MAAQWLDQHTFGIPGILSDALRRFNQVRGTEAAASISYYAIFSIPPLLLVLLWIAGAYLVDVEQEQELVIQFLTSVTPIPEELIANALGQFSSASGIGGLIGVIGLVYAASGALFTLIRNINRAWPEANETHPFKGRLVAAGLVGIMVVLMIVWTLTITVITIISMMKLPVLSGILDLNYLPWEFSSRLLTWLTAFLAFIALYRFIPNVRVRWREAFWGALLATAAWNLVSAAFTWLLSAGLINYEDIYGPLATTLAFLTWVYVSAFIVVFGAHLSAAVGRKIGRQVQIVPTRVEIPDT